MGARALSAPQSSPHPGAPGPGSPPSCCYDNQFCEDMETRIVSVRWAGRDADSPHARSDNFMIMRKKENTSSSSSLKGTQEARRAPGTGDPSFNSCAGSSTSVHSFTDDLGYQGSRELSSEEEPGLAPARRQKRSLRKHKGEKDEQEEDEADRGPPPRRSRRPRQKERPSPSAPGSGAYSQSPASRWSLAGLRRCLCGCCCARWSGRGSGSGAPRPDG
ncbi:uncharacterized protein LOC116576614 isoform X2 [Mustela erminea]|uniref:uncharacterized protein LOC116576614 isoform X2 n=1 Tax=Mustela erminea TaxID=36723 RepID=UPI0013868836|nr:uncharacterized protein LOC116576614 isoform X2 [Mustela erminea]